MTVWLELTFFPEFVFWIRYGSWKQHILFGYSKIGPHSKEMLNLHSLDMYTAHLKYVSQLGSVGATFFFRLCALSWLLWTQTYSSALRGRGGGASPHFWSKGQTYLLLDIMKDLDINGFLHTATPTSQECCWGIKTGRQYLHSTAADRHRSF